MYLHKIGVERSEKVALPVELESTAVRRPDVLFTARKLCAGVASCICAGKEGREDGVYNPVNEFVEDTAVVLVRLCFSSGRSKYVLILLSNM
ncbi:hypothetical protein TNIN_162321 [Trichonephila inaurata madagascariensis]|uniref:Uncharacterized protein n=1 Tax=Trichonephila inaurata madagascariensis TaxID=2747483 RepID=A0A8X6XS14_9ARAC|nr:hypothetical protein TNIN_162321 [Trichonephila inaurata madagascariensis]